MSAEQDDLLYIKDDGTSIKSILDDDTSLPFLIWCLDINGRGSFWKVRESIRLK